MLTHVFLTGAEARRGALKPASFYEYSVHHFMAAAKPWLLGATRCVSFWDFLDAPREPILPPTASCVRWHEERRRAALQMEAPSWPPCGGMRVLVL